MRTPGDSRGQQVRAEPPVPLPFGRWSRASRQAIEKGRIGFDSRRLSSVAGHLPIEVGCDDEGSVGVFAELVTLPGSELTGDAARGGQGLRWRRADTGGRSATGLIPLAGRAPAATANSSK